MIPKICDSKGLVIGDLNDCLKGIVIEERNGMLEAELEYQLFYPYWDKLVRGNIFTADVNDKIKNQKFRIYKVGKNIFGRFTVYARHISYDVQRDMIDGLDIQNQSCEYCLNMIFRNSQFSQNFRGHSDIVNSQNFKIGPTHLLSAIGGTRGSILDTFGTGAEIKRDNYDFYVLNKRGHDNDVTIEYSKNLTGLDYTEDEEGLITRIKAIAKYKLDSGEETEIFTYVDSPKILDYETPFVKSIDFSDKFEDGETPTTEKLERLGEKYFNDNKCDFVKFNYKISFIPLSKCAGYSNIEDKIELCDTVRIKDYRYNLDTKAKVIKATYDFLRERYESMELGEPRTSLGDIIGNGNTSDVEDLPTAGPQGPPGQDGTNGVDAIYVNLTNDSHIVPTLSDGAGGNYTGCETTIELYKGADKLNYGVSYEAEQIEGVTASLSGNVYSISNMTVDSCNVGLRATYNGKTYLKYFNVSKSKKGVDGTDGVTYYTWIRYADDGKGNGISNDPTGKEYIGFAYNKTTPIESNVPGDYTWSLIKGIDGVPGQNGSDGTTYYTWIKYSDYADGNPCYEIPNSNTKYIGIATNKTTPKESNDPNDYVWSKFKGDDGVDGTDGKDAYTVNISNDSHVFAAESDGRISSEQSTSTKVVAFKGTNTVPFTIGNLPSISGLNLSKNVSSITITALTGYNLDDSGSFEIPITVEGLTFKKVFSWSKAKKGVDGSLGDFPDTLPTVPTLEYELYGFVNIGLNWTFENKMYYQYELYASKTKDFTPNTFDLIHQGQTSSFLFQARPNETWYFKVCGINSHGRRTAFSNQAEVTTKKIDDLSNYVENAAIGDALIGELNLGRGWFGQLRGNYIDAKQLTVTDGNNKRTLDIDSFGRVSLDVTSLKITNQSVATEEFANNKSNNAYNNALNDSKGYTNNQINGVNSQISNINSQVNSVKSEIGVIDGKIDLKVSKNDVVNQINLSTEGAKIKANKIQLEGTVTAGDPNGNYAQIDKGNYTVRDSGAAKAFFGFRNMEQSGYDDYVVPKLAMGAYGYGANHNFFTIVTYRGKDNPQNVNSAYCDIAYHCLTPNGYSNLKFYDGGDVRLAPIKNLEITSDYSNGKLNPNGYERRVALFTTSGYDWLNEHIQTGGLSNHSNGNGLILSDRYRSDSWDGSQSGGGSKITSVRVHTDSNGEKFFRPTYENGNIQCGSGSFAWKSVHSRSAYSSEGVVANTEIKAINNITIDNVLDNITFPNDNAKVLSNKEGIKVDITNLQGTKFVDISNGYAYIDNNEMIKLLLKEVKELKEEIEILKNK